MRRMIWLAAGAVLGAAGYRRLDRAAKSLTGQLGQGSVTRQAVQVSLAAGIVRRAGALLARRAAGVGLAGLRRVSIATFLGDVREGMDEYLDAHASQATARQLEARQSAARPVEAPARREIGSSRI